MAALPTSFAPAERASRDVLEKEAAWFRDGLFRTLFDRIPEMALILNRERQIVYANGAAMQAFRAESLDSILGRRPGELWHCKHADNGGDCGTTLFCRYCGAVNGVLTAQSGKIAVEECRLTLERDGYEEPLDLRIYVYPVDWQSEQFTFVAMTDIADEKRRSFLEKTFLHDMTNTAMALRGFWSLAASAVVDQAKQAEYLETVGFLAKRILDEIEAQRLLTAAEENRLELNVRRLDSLRILRDIFKTYEGKHPQLEIAPESEAVTFESDATLVRRVIGNMVKNAVEDSESTGKVTVGCRRDAGKVVFWAHNAGYMPEPIRLQVFQRSFSTKGEGRGLGTYSMKYFTEKYLGGRIWFTSSEEEGTTFMAAYPLSLCG